MSKWEVLVLVFYIAVAIGLIAFGAWLFELIMASNMPDWLKYFLLK